MNKVILTGRTTADVEVRQSRSGIDCARFSLAVDRPRKRGDDGVTDFFTVICFRDTALFAGRHLPKGGRVTVEGRLQTRSFTGDDGRTVKLTEVVAEKIEPIDWKKNEDAGQSYNPYDGESKPYIAAGQTAGQTSSASPTPAPAPSPSPAAGIEEQIERFNREHGVGLTQTTPAAQAPLTGPDVTLGEDDLPF